MLEDYGKKRDFSQTPEPAPQPHEGEAPSLTFVVQKHAATRLHYDFRLQLDGVLKSWAVPKGPSLNPQDKHLAVMVEDHPLDYGSFEGVIPKGQYGAGHVIVWDSGTYSPDEGGKLSFHDREDADRRMREGLAKGKISIFLRGRKLKGSWTLVKTKRAPNDWLLIKHQDQFVDQQRDVLTDDRSVLSGLTIEDLKAGRLPPAQRADSPPLTPSALPGARKAPLPARLTPMLPSLAERPFSHPGWLFEPKLDGIRAVALVRDGKVKLSSRRGLDCSRQYPALAAEIARQPDAELALDGEIVALDDQGRPSFELLQQRMNLTRDQDIQVADSRIPVVYFVFDLLYLNGYDLRSASLEHRKALLESVLIPSHAVRFLDHFDQDGEAAYEAAVANGLEGVLAKRADSHYEAGRRSHLWLKVKATLSEDFVVGGYSQGQGARADTFGALLLGTYEPDGRLTYVGHVGTGFDDRLLRQLKERLDRMATDACPFVEMPPLKGPTTWVKPELVAEVKFAQRTGDGLLRAPVFLRLREDKSPAEAVRLEVAPAPEDAPPPAPQAPSVADADVQDVLDQLRRREDKFLLKVQDHKIPLNNLNKEMWPKLGRRRALTKRDLVAYLARVSPDLLPHMRDRPITLVRFPNGIDGQRFYQRHQDDHRPPFLETVRLYSDHNNGDTEHLVCNNLATLLWLGQLADLELHTWYSRIDPHPDGHHLSRAFAGSLENIQGSLLNYPDFIVFDLDPYIYSGKEASGAEPELNRAAFAQTCDVALWLKEVLDSLKLPSFVKTTGKTGLHVFVPILRQLDYDATRSLCETIGRFVLQGHPNEVTMEWATKKRTGKIFLDHNQNVRSKTLASIYSPRAAPEAAVSMPLAWDELENVYPADFTILTAPDRIAKVGDLWAGILDAKHDLRALLDLVEDGRVSA